MLMLWRTCPIASPNSGSYSAAVGEKNEENNLIRKCHHDKNSDSTSLFIRKQRLLGAS